LEFDPFALPVLAAKRDQTPALATKTTPTLIKFRICFWWSGIRIDTREEESEDLKQVSWGFGHPTASEFA
jgi:hypothetical protein